MFESSIREVAPGCKERALEGARPLPEMSQFSLDLVFFPGKMRAIECTPPSHLPALPESVRGLQGQHYSICALRSDRLGLKPSPATQAV